MADNETRAYRLEPHDTSGLFLGLGAIQCVILGAGITTSVGSLTLGLPLSASVLPVLAAAALTFARLRGQPAWEWLLLGMGWLRGNRKHRWFAPLPLWPNAGQAAMPPCLDGVDIVEIDLGLARQLGAVRDRRRRTLTAIVPVKGAQFLAKPCAEQERLLAGWGNLLGQFAVERGVVTHLSWSDLARPSGIQEHLAWTQGRLDDCAVPDAAASYRELLATAQPIAMSHEIAITVTVAHDRLTRSRKIGGADDALSRALAGATESLVRSVQSASLDPSPPLDANGIRRLLQARFDPLPPRTARPGRLAQRLNLDSAPPSAMVLEERWREIRMDDNWHRTWWIGTWPRSPMPAAWMEPFLSAGSMTRAVTVVLMPVSARQSRRRIERDLVKLESDATAKEDKGRRVDARHRRTTRALLEREDEIVAGYPEVAYAGFVTIAARTLGELDEHSEIMEQLARESGIELRLLAARQAAGWAAALPFGLAPVAVLAS